MKIKVSTLTGRALNWAASCVLRDYPLEEFWEYERPEYQPSTNMEQGIQLIDLLIRRGLTIHGMKCRYASDPTIVNADVNGHYPQSGPTVLIAVTRCFVASKFGEEIDIPNELL